MDLKAIILDIDGTLYTSKKTVSERTYQALMKAQQQGITIVLASGRPVQGMRELIEELELKRYGGICVTYNGAIVVDASTGKQLYKKVMDVETSKALLEHLKAFKVIPMVELDDTLYVNDVYDNRITIQGKPFNIIEYEARGNGYTLCEKTDLAAFVDFPMGKLLIAGEADYLKAHEHEIKAPFKDKLVSLFSAPFYYEFTAQGVDKGAALYAVLTPMGILPEHCIAFGDGHNDLSIIRYAGLGVAMGNAVDEIKQAAKRVTTSNDEDGIALVIESYLK